MHIRQNKPKINEKMENPAVKWGLYYGIASIALFLIFYLVNPSLVFSVNGIIGLVLMILFPVLACREERTNLGGFASFGDMFKVGFITLLVGAILGTVFSYVFMNFIDPGMIDLQREIATKQIESISGFMGEEATEKAIEDIENSNPVSLGKSAMGFGVILVMAAIISAIIGAIMKKKNPADF